METAPANRGRQFAAAWCVIASLWMASGPLAVAGPTADPGTSIPAAPSAFEPVARIAAWPPWFRGARPLFDRSAAPVPAVPDTPHPAVARIIVPEERRHRVRQRHAGRCPRTIRPRGHQLARRARFARHGRSRVSQRLPLARPAAQGRLRLGPGGARDLAAADRAGGSLRDAAATGRPAHDPRLRPGPVPHRHRPLHRLLRAAAQLPTEMVELDVEARQGDSGGPIFNQRGELAGVLFGAGEGTTIGSFAPRVETFLASLAPDIGSGRGEAQVAVADRPGRRGPPSRQRNPSHSVDGNQTRWKPPEDRPSSAVRVHRLQINRRRPPPCRLPPSNRSRRSGDGSTRIKSALALVGLAAVALQLMSAGEIASYSDNLRPQIGNNLPRHEAGQLFVAGQRRDLLDQRARNVRDTPRPPSGTPFRCPESSLRLASVIVNSASMSDSDRTPRMITRALHSRTNRTASPSNCSHYHVAQPLRHAANQLDPLVGREQRLLVDVRCRCRRSTHRPAGCSARSHSDARA